jgi:hypothetical protein
MSRSNYQTLLDHGRKAGLNTAELYSAMSTRAPEATESAPGTSDSNGYVAGVNATGQRVYRPLGPYPRS